MSDAATAATTVEEGRALALELMIDECVIERTTGAKTLVDGVAVPAAPTTVYEGPCQFQLSEGLNAENPRAGERVRTVLRSGPVKVPLDATGIEVSDVVRCTAVGEVSDPELVDRRFRIQATHAKTYATSRRLQVEEVAR